MTPRIRHACVGPAVSARFLLLRSIRSRVPEGRREIAGRGRLVVIVVDGHDLAVGPDDGTDVTEVASAAVVAERERVAPGATLVFAEAGANAKRHSAITIDQAE